ncbi:MAG TPA: DMT family transporter [Bacteroidota bacterium]|nr:DMT family transporter [Bacteroidota bacterium]
MNIYVVVLLQVLLAGCTHIVAKAVVADVDPLALTFLRSVISCGGLYFLLKVRGRRVSLKREDRGRMMLVGMMATLNQLLYLLGMKHTTAANGALLYATTPVLVLILSGSILREKITAWKAAGVVLAFAGVAVIMFERGLTVSSEYTLGNILIFLAVVAWSLFTVIGRPLVLRYGPLPSTSAATFMGSAMYFPVGIAATWSLPFGALSLADWMGILYLGIGTSILSYLLWYAALQRIDAGRLAVFANGQPIVATILSVIFLRYSVTGVFAVGSMLTILGVILAQEGSMSRAQHNARMHV